MCVRFLEAVSCYLSPHKAIWDHRGNIAVFVRKQSLEFNNYFFISNFYVNKFHSFLNLLKVVNSRIGVVGAVLQTVPLPKNSGLL